MLKRFLLTFFIASQFVVSFSHNLDLKAIKTREWNLVDNSKFKASFLMLKEGEVFLEKSNSETVHYHLNSFSNLDQEFIKERYAIIQKQNESIVISQSQETSSYTTFDYKKIIGVFLFLVAVWAFSYFIFQRQQLKYITYLLLVGLASIGYSFSANYLRRINSTTNPLSMDSAFVPFKPNVVTRWDNSFFYVESKGIPTTHAMMTGITGWQQQVPIPQCYIGNNAWSIPLNPVVAAVPVPVSPAHFSRGAIAVAVNGVAIFNPYTNTGVDAFLDGQLDNWGGHCGRADDYHYHTAPLHLYGSTSQKLPIAYALDGFAVYGNLEPDGSSMKVLDANHGHYGTNGVYHYHGSAAAPYMIGNMVGQITEDTTHQIIPQASANPIRPAGTPLKGAVITGCVANGSNGYILSYTLSGQTYQVSYSWTSNGVYSFNFINPGGTTTSTYNGFKPCFLSSGINDYKTNSGKILLYPNPARGEFSIELSSNIQQDDVRSIDIISMEGKIIFSSKAYQKKIKTDVFSKGVYFVIVKTASENYTYKFVMD